MYEENGSVMKKSSKKMPDEHRIVEEIQSARKPLSPDALIKRFNISVNKHDDFLEEIDALIKRGVLFKNRKGALLLPEAIDLIVGTVIGHPDGYGFLRPDGSTDKNNDFYLPASEMFKVLHGDRVTARRLLHKEQGRVSVEILDVLARAHREIVGRLHQKHGVWFVVAEDKRLNQDFLLAPHGRGKAQDGDIVVVEMVEPPSATREAIVRVKEILGAPEDDGIEIEIALRRYDLPFRFSNQAKQEAKKYGEQVKNVDKKTREDLRDLPFVTIDGKDARDFDDAVFAEKNGHGYHLLVAIADVSHYVRDGSALDKEAYERGTSVYFPRRVIPMLPEVLSNGLCSLNPEVDRLVMVCDMQISSKGAIQRYQFYPAVIRSQARLTYDQVWAYLSGSMEKGLTKKIRILDSLDCLYGLFQRFFEARKKRGAIDFDGGEVEIRFNERGKIESIVPMLRNDAHRLIEECMLAANVCAADFVRTHERAALYRIHEGPTSEKLGALRAFLSLCGLQLGGGEHPTAKDYAQLLKKVEHRDDKDLLQMVLLRSLQRAEYSSEEKGHFGLSYKHYAHFTSPIRRYPDLLVHRVIKSILAETTYRPGCGSWRDAGVHCSVTERRADEASREVETWLKCIYMQQHLGEVMYGTVSGVTHFGLFVTLDGLAIDGLIHISELGEDYFHFDDVRHALVGQRSGKEYRLAERMSVQVVRADPDSGKIDFVQADNKTGHRDKNISTKKPSGSLKKKAVSKNSAEIAKMKINQRKKR